MRLLSVRRNETAEQIQARIREEIKRENLRNLTDPKLLLNNVHRLDGSLHEAEREQVTVIVDPTTVL